MHRHEVRVRVLPYRDRRFLPYWDQDGLVQGRRLRLWVYRAGVVLVYDIGIPKALGSLSKSKLSRRLGWE